jgi:hypothetical protein
MSEPIAWIIKLPSGWFRCKENSTQKRQGYTGSIHAKRYPTREAALEECNEGEVPVALLSKWGKTG